MITHFTAALIFALVTSVVFGVVSKYNDRDRLIYGLRVFGLFVAISFAGAWMMYVLHG